MLWSKLKEFYKRGDDSESMEETGFISYYPKDEYIIEIEDEYGETLASDYLQICRDENNDDAFVFQVLIDSENPINMAIENDANDTNITVKIYKRIRHLIVD